MNTRAIKSILYLNSWLTRLNLTADAPFDLASVVDLPPQRDRPSLLPPPLPLEISRSLHGSTSFPGLRNTRYSSRGATYLYNILPVPEGVPHLLHFTRYTSWTPPLLLYFSSSFARPAPSSFARPAYTRLPDLWYSRNVGPSARSHISILKALERLVVCLRVYTCVCVCANVCVCVCARVCTCVLGKACVRIYLYI